MSMQEEDEGSDEEDHACYFKKISLSKLCGCAGGGNNPRGDAASLDQAKAGRQHILREMQSCDPPPAKQLSQYAPRIRRFNIDPDKIGQVINSGGRNIKMLQAAAGCDEIMVSVYQ